MLLLFFKGNCTISIWPWTAAVDLTKKSAKNTQVWRFMHVLYVVVVVTFFLVAPKPSRNCSYQEIDLCLELTYVHVPCWLSLFARLSRHTYTQKINHTFKSIRKKPSYPITKDEKNRERLHTLLCTADLPLIWRFLAQNSNFWYICVPI